MSKTLSDATPNVFQIINGEKMKHPSHYIHQNLYRIKNTFQDLFSNKIKTIHKGLIYIKSKHTHQDLIHIDQNLFSKALFK